MRSLKEEEPVPNDAIVPFVDALAAAKEFLINTGLPPSIEWFELWYAARHMASRFRRSAETSIAAASPFSVWLPPILR